MATSGSRSHVFTHRLLTTREVAELFAVSRHTIWRWRAAGHLAAIKIGRDYRFAPDDIRQLVEAEPDSPQAELQTMS